MTKRKIITIDSIISELYRNDKQGRRDLTEFVSKHGWRFDLPPVELELHGRRSVFKVLEMRTGTLHIGAEQEGDHFYEPEGFFTDDELIAMLDNKEVRAYFDKKLESSIKW